MVRAILLHKRHNISLDINPSVGILYFACCVLAYWEIHHAGGRLLDLFFLPIVVSISLLLTIFQAKDLTLSLFLVPVAADQCG